MSPAAGGAAPTQPAASDAVAPAAIAAQESGRAAQPPSQENPRDPAALQEGADPGNAAARKTAWNVPPPPPAAAAPGGIIGGEESWPALADSTRAWPKSASSDSLSLSDGSAPSAPEDLIVPLLPVSNPISPGPNPTFTLPPLNAIPATSSRQNGSANRPNLVGHGGGNGSSEVDGSGGNGNNGGRGSSKNSSSDDNRSSGGDGNWNNGVLGGGRGCNSSHRDNNSRNNGGGANDNGRRTNINGNSRGGGSNNFTGSGEGSSRNGGGGGGNHWSNNARNGNSSNNGFGSRGGRNRRDNERGGSFSPRNYPRFSPVPHQQQQLGIYQPGSFHRPPPAPPPGHFMVPPAFMPYVPPFAYPIDAQAYPFYITPIDQQFQNMHLVQQPMHPLWVHQDQQGLQEDIRQQIEFYFSTNNLCHDTYLREHMDEQGWVPIDLLVEFPMLRRFITLGVDNNYILDAIRGSEILEVQGNKIRRHNDWADWLLH